MSDERAKLIFYSSYTFAQSINADGVIAGRYLDASFTSHGYIRDQHGAFTTFDAPGPTWPQSINEEGAIAGYYFNASNTVHGFVRRR